MSDTPPPPPPPPPPAPASAQPQAAPKGPSSLVIGLISAAALLVVVALGVVVTTVVLSQAASSTSQSYSSSSKDDDDDDEDDDEESTPKPTASVESDDGSADEAEAPAEAPVLFQSVSGNIQCSLGTGGVICHQNSINYTPPSSACEAGLGGATVGLDRTGIIWPCLDTAITGANPLDYDVPITAYGYTCSINYDTGITCYNKLGDGFGMEYNSGIYSF